MAKSFLDRFSNDIGIDLGTANTLVYLGGKGVVINEPSVVAINTKTGSVVAVGKVAKDMLGKTPAHIKAIRPIIDGVVSDFEITEEMIGYHIKKANSLNTKILGPRVVVGVPSETTTVELKAVKDASLAAGARKVFIVEEPMAAAIGLSLPINESIGSMVIDIGGGTTDIAVIALFGVVNSKSLKIAGDRFNSDIINYLKQEYKIIVGEKTAEDIKILVGSVSPDGKLTTKVRGRDMTSGLPKEININDHDVSKAIGSSINILIDGIRKVIEKTPPEILGDIVNTGLYLTGGGAYIRGLSQLISKELNIPVMVPEDPMSLVAKGCGKILENIEFFKEVLKEVE
jgi:rod shape-determining protein MreB and related proteins